MHLVDTRVGHVVRRQEGRRQPGAVEVQAESVQAPRRLHKAQLVVGPAQADEDGQPRQLHAHGQHALEVGLVQVATKGGHLARRGHLHAQDGIGALETAEGELRRLHPHVVQVDRLVGA